MALDFTHGSDGGGGGGGDPSHENLHLLADTILAFTATLSKKMDKCPMCVMRFSICNMMASIIATEEMTKGEVYDLITTLGNYAIKMAEEQTKETK